MDFSSVLSYTFEVQPHKNSDIGYPGFPVFWRTGQKPLFVISYEKPVMEIVHQTDSIATEQVTSGTIFTPSDEI
jgi:hypothetical protein